TFACVSNRSGAAHAGIAAGDERLSSEQATGTFVALFAMIRARLHLARESRPRLRLFLERRLRIFLRRIFQLLRCHSFLLLFRGQATRHRETGDARTEPCDYSTAADQVLLVHHSTKTFRAMF